MTLTHRRHLLALLLFLCTMMLATSLPAWTPPKHIPIAGDWNKYSSGDNPGFYNTETGTFFLCTTNWANAPLRCPAYAVALPRGAFRLPLIGRWSADDTKDRPALYDPSTGTLQLFRFSDCLPDTCDAYGGLTLDGTRELGLRGAQAVSGDWDGDGIDTVALVVPESSQGALARHPFARFYRAGHQAALKDIPLTIDVQHFQAIAGHWPGTSISGDSLGFFDAQERTLLLYDGWTATSLLSVAGPSDATMAFGGRWIVGHDGLGLYTPMRPDCPPRRCHRVNYHEVMRDIEAAIFPPDGHPHLDSRFPDDPGGPDS